MNKQQGFSLIELVIVIIVVGILAATAMPRFLNITEQAKKAAVEGMAGGYATAVISARAQWEAYGRPTMQGVSGAVNSVDYDGSEFLLTKESNQDGIRMGYPYALSIDGSSKPFSAMAPQDCVDLLENLLQNPPRASLDQQSIPSGNSVFFVSMLGSGSEKACRYYQTTSVKNSSGIADITTGHYFTYTPATGRVEVNINN